MKLNRVTGETFDHKAAAIFDREPDAEHAAERVRSHTTTRNAQVFVISPRDPHPGKELEPEDRGIWQTLVRSHVWLAVAGAAVGLLFFALLIALGVGFIRDNAMVAAVIIVVFFAVFGMMVAGLITLRPDHMPYLMTAQSALKEGKFVVAVHASSASQLQEAVDELNRIDADPVRSL